MWKILQPSECFWELYLPGASCDHGHLHAITMVVCLEAWAKWWGLTSAGPLGVSSVDLLATCCGGMVALLMKLTVTVEPEHFMVGCKNCIIFHVFLTTFCSCPEALRGRFWEMLQGGSSGTEPSRNEATSLWKHMRSRTKVTDLSLPSHSFKSTLWESRSGQLHVTHQWNIKDYSWRRENLSQNVSKDQRVFRRFPSWWC